MVKQEVMNVIFLVLDKVEKALWQGMGNNDFNT
jgi:hypothetical protein